MCLWLLFAQDIKTHLFWSVFLCSMVNKETQISLFFYKLYFFIQLWGHAGPSWGVKETNTSQTEWQECNKNSFQDISQCKNLLYAVHSVCLYLHGHEQKYKQSKKYMYYIQDKSFQRWRLISYQNKYIYIHFKSHISGSKTYLEDDWLSLSS